jgi:predicted CXXCH cytochrome family protein
MDNFRKRFVLSIGFVSVAVILGILTFVTGQVRASAPDQETENYCLSCHNDPDASMVLPSGEEVSLYISPDDLKHSIHSPLGIECEACHTEIKTYPHPETNFQTAREISQAYILSCNKCHSSIYEKAQDSIHAQIAAENSKSPICTDCHGSHNIQTPDVPRSRVSSTCSQCHSEIFYDYQSSVHGSALINQDNPDVPVCTDCHGVHNIQDPRTDQFHVETPELCAGCHADAELMKKYNLPADVYDIYALSWHGVDVSVYKARWPTIWHDSAVCTDCHGIHDILNTDDPLSSVNPANLLATCQKCHPDAGPNWTGAWTGHNEISLERTPLLYYVKTFYDSFVYIVLWGAGIYVLLEIIRATVNRIRRNLR